MTDPGLSESVRHLIETSIPSMEALEVLILLASEPDRAFTSRTVFEASRAARLAESTAREHLALFLREGLLQEQDGAFRYHPRTPETGAAVIGLIVAYRERPVTLIRAVYEVAETKRIRAFADAFKLRKKE